MDVFDSKATADPETADCGCRSHTSDQFRSASITFVVADSSSQIERLGYILAKSGARSVLSNPEMTVSKYVEDYIDSGKPLGFYIVRHFSRSVDAFIALRRVPCYKIVPSARPEGAAIRARILRHSALARITGLTTAVLTLPRDPSQYLAGAPKRTLRKKMHKARRLGLSWAQVNDPQRRRSLLKLANECERNHPDVAYRIANPDNHDLLRHPLWLTAFSADGRPLLLCVVIIDHQLAMLCYFRTLGSGPEQSTARYFMTEVLAEQLIRRGVRYLFDDTSPFRLNNGLRHFQRMVGFRIARVHIARRAPNLIDR